MRSLRMTGEGGVEAVDVADGGVAACEVHAVVGSKNASSAAAAADGICFLVLAIIAVTSVVDLVSSASQSLRPAVSDRAAGHRGG
ncbi:hypothetical protein [Micromonospora sp. WMMD980]|uniref:hypothetical protein n=1 Tax=Micromonospora sp. WMMD980 TaxID=3016088 RepID=UPI0024160CB0|nr:hypothetical protein [Micromonospora sp. WMMD980]MDG4801994.1 hypothetical protein [Micromonospora sp. WMMD980]